MRKDGRGKKTSLWLHILHGHHAMRQGGRGRGQVGSGAEAGKVHRHIKPINNKALNLKLALHGATKFVVRIAVLCRQAILHSCAFDLGRVRGKGFEWKEHDDGLTSLLHSCLQAVRAHNFHSNIEGNKLKAKSTQGFLGWIIPMLFIT